MRSTTTTASGPGSLFARGSMKKLWHAGLDVHGAVSVAVGRFMTQTDDDSTTSGPDVSAGSWPTVAVVDAGASGSSTTSLIAAVVDTVLAVASAAGRRAMSQMRSMSPRAVDGTGRTSRARASPATPRSSCSAATTGSPSSPRALARPSPRSPRSMTASDSPRSANTTSSRTSASPAFLYADLRGYSYDRSDVTARGLANAYAQTLGAVFLRSPSLRSRIVVAEGRHHA